MRKFLTKIREKDGVVRAEVVDANDLKRGTLAAAAFVRSKSGVMAAQHLVPVVQSSNEEPKSGVVKIKRPRLVTDAPASDVEASKESRKRRR